MDKLLVGMLFMGALYYLSRRVYKQLRNTNCHQGGCNCKKTPPKLPTHLKQ